MKKLYFLTIACISVLFSGYSQVQIGSANNVSQNLPINTAANYTYSQSIYLASEINTSGTITCIQWYYAGSSSLPNSQGLVIYMGATSKTSFTDGYDWAPNSNLTQVYSGPIPTNSVEGWKTLTLQTPFIYDGTSNLIVATDENSPALDSGINKFWNSQVPGNRSIGLYSNSTNIDPTNLPTSTQTGVLSYQANYVPDIILCGLSQTCVMPYYYTVSNITPTSATVTWQASTPAPTGGSDYYISTTATTPDNGTSPTGSIVSGNTKDLSSLIPNTTYYFWVRNNCGNSTYSAWSEMTTFTTECTPIASFNENFDNTTVPNLPSCWSKILRGATLSSSAAIKTAPSNFNSSPNSVSLANAGSTGSYDIILVSPKVSTLDAGTYRLKFYAKGVGSIDVGTLNSNLSDATFNVVQSFTTTATEDLYLVSFTAHTSDTYIGIRLSTPTTFKTVYVDDIIWEYTPNCPDVTLLTVPVVTPTSATFNWVSNGGDSFDIAVGDSNATDPSTLAPYGNSTTSTFTKSGLLESTNYNVWVRSVCTTGGNGAWIGPIPFQTDCNASSTFNENFDSAIVPNLPSCWTKILRGSGLSANAQISTIADFANSSPNSLLLQNSNSSGIYDIIAVSPNISTLPLNTYRLKFHATGASTLEIGTLNTNTNFATFTPLIGATIATTNQDKEYLVDFSGYTDNGDSHIGIRLATTSTQNIVYLDDIKWELTPTCPDVTNIKITDIKSTEVSLSWMGSGTESNWNIAVGLSTDTDPNGLPVTNSVLESKTIKDLTPNTAYNVWVRSDCGSDKGVWIGPLKFSTYCAAVGFFNEDFEVAIVPNLPTCWTKILRGTGLSASAAVQSDYAQTTPKTPTTHAKLFNAESAATCDIMLVSPNITTLGDGTYRLKFTVNGKADPKLEIGTLNNNSATATFTVLQTVPVGSTQKDYVINFDLYGGTTDQYIGFRLATTSGYKTAYIDNIVWEPIPLCADVLNVSVPYASTTSASVIWEVQGSEILWDVAVGATTVTDPNTLTPMPATTNYLEVPDLTAATAYKVWVRAHCPHQVDYPYGAWIGPITFNTDCYATDTFYENFDGVPSAPSDILPACWKRIVRGTNEILSDAAISTGGAASSSPNYITLVTQYNCPLDADIILVSPSVTNLKAGTNLLTFYASGNKLLQVGTLNKDSYDAVFTPFTDVNTSGINGSDNKELHTVDFSTYTGTDTIIGFRLKLDSEYASNPYCSLDTISWTPTLGNNQFGLSQLNYYPNPVKDVFNLSYDKNINTIAVYNLLGQEVLYESINKTSAGIDMSSIANGVYLVKVTSDDQIKTIKIVKE